MPSALRLVFLLIVSQSYCRKVHNNAVFYTDCKIEQNQNVTVNTVEDTCSDQIISCYVCGSCPLYFNIYPM